jgi:hypothetical protein
MKTPYIQQQGRYVAFYLLFVRIYLGNNWAYVV